MREKRTAKRIIEEYANELISRTADKDAAIKLLVVETIAHRMGWTELYNRVRYKQKPLMWWEKED